MLRLVDWHIVTDVFKDISALSGPADKRTVVLRNVDNC